MSDSVRPHRLQPTRLPRPWDSPGKNTGVGCHFLLQCRKVKSESEVTQSCLTLSDPMDCSLPGSSVHGIFQARVLECGAIAFSAEEDKCELKPLGCTLVWTGEDCVCLALTPTVSFKQMPHSWQVDVSYVSFALKEDNKEKSKSHESLLIFDSNIT